MATGTDLAVTMTEPLDLPRHPAIRVVDLFGKGRGVVAIEPIHRGELIEASPVIPLRAADALAKGHALFDYAFAWETQPFAEAIALGMVSLANHSPHPNASLAPDYRAKTLRLVALRDIEEGEEITIDYGIPLWFEEA